MAILLKKPGLFSFLLPMVVTVFLSPVGSADNDEEKLEQIIKWSKKNAVRKNGVLLQATVEVKELKKEPKDKLFLIHWTMDYTGPRQPLIILPPSLDMYGFGEVSFILFYFSDQKGNGHAVAIHPRRPSPLPGAGPSDNLLGGGGIQKKKFITIKKMEVAKGTMEISMNRLKGETLRKYQDNLIKFSPNLLYLQLQYFPDDRGRFYNLDAWTGNLQTELILVPIANLFKD